MDQQFNSYNHSFENEDQTYYRPPRKTNRFETASLVLSIGAVLCCSSFYIAYILGALAILFALLSRGGGMKFAAKAKAGIILGIGSIILSTVITAGALYLAIEEYGSVNNILREYAETYDIDLSELGIEEIHEY